MQKMNVSKLEAQLRDAARELLPQIGITEAEDGIAVTAKQGYDGLRVSYDGGISIEYQHKCQFFRALSLVKRVLRSGKAIEEHPTFTRLFFGEDLIFDVYNLPTGGSCVRLGSKKVMLYE